MKKLISAVLAAAILTFTASQVNAKPLLPTTAQAGAISAGKSMDGKLLIFGYVAGFVQGLQMGKVICAPAGKSASKFNEEIVDILIASLEDPTVIKDDTLLIVEISDVLRKNYPCATL